MKQRGIAPGLWYMGISAVFFSLMGLCVRLLKEIPFMEVVVVRAAISAVLSAVLLIRAKKSVFGRNKPLLILRGICGFTALSAYFYTIQSMPLAEAVTIHYTNPLFGALFAPLVLKEKGTGREWLAGSIAFSGVLLIANPSSLSSLVPALIGLAGAMCSGMAYTIVRKLGTQGEDPLTIVMYFPVITLIAGVPVAATVWIPPTLTQILLLLAVGVTTQVAQVSLTEGLKRERVARATVVNYLVIFLSTMYSLILGEQLYWTSFAGMALIIAGILFLRKDSLRISP